MAFNQGMVSSNKEDWETDPNLYKIVNNMYGFKYDLAANEKNTKCYNFFSKEDNALEKDWSILDGWLWCNPPYSKDTTEPFVRKALKESHKGAKSVLLLACRPDTYYWKEVILPNAFTWFIRGKIKFVGAEYLAPFASALVEFGGGRIGYGTLDKKTGETNKIIEISR